MKPTAAALSVILVLAFFIPPFPSFAQQSAKVYRIGWLGTTTGGVETDSHHCPIQGLSTWQAAMAGLREYGYMPGQNLLIECRWTEGRGERAAALAVELVSLTPDLIVTTTYGNVRAVKQATVFAAKQATSMIPIVMVGVGDPTADLVASLAHPGSNVTGLTSTVGLETYGRTR